MTENLQVSPNAMLIGQAAKTLSVTRTTIYRWLDKGMLPTHYHTITKRVVIMGKDLIKFWKSVI